MKILFHDYSNETTTEPKYLTVALRHCGVETHLWNDRRVSAFDMFDTVKPDVFVSHYSMVTSDIIKYLERNDQVKLVVNATGMSNTQMIDFEKFMVDKGINVPFIFTNSLNDPQPVLSFGVENILPAFDLFAMQNAPKGQPLCPKAIFASTHSDAVKQEQVYESALIANGGVYHLVQFTNGDIDPLFDIRSNATSAHGLYDKYGSFTLVGDVNFCCSQLFFDLSMNSSHVTVKADKVEGFQNFLTEVFTDDGFSTDVRVGTKFKAGIGVQLRNQLKSSHTPFHRAETLVKFLGDKEDIEKVTRALGHLPDAIKEL